MNKKHVLYFLAAVLGALILRHAASVLVTERFAEINARIERAERVYAEIADLQEKYARSRRDYAYIGRTISERGFEYTPVAFLEELALDYGINHDLVYREPRPLRGRADFMETAVWVELNDVGMEELVQYLYRLEISPELLRVRNFNVRPQGGRLRVTFEVATIIPRP